MTNPDGPRGLARGLTNYGDPDFALYLRRSFATSMGYSKAMLARPVVGIAQSASGFNNCHRHFPELIEAVKRGVLAAGGLPIDFPTISLGEVFLNPTSMMFRNLMAMDVEEMIRDQPMDAVVLVGGCDKTVPAQLMGATSADVPAVQLLAGPMLPMAYRGERLGACTDCRRFWAKYRAGGVTAAEIERIEENLATTAGTCAVMGTASTMASIAEALGMALPGTAAIPAVHADRLRAAEASGQRAVALATTRLRPSQIITQRSVENALRVLLAADAYQKVGGLEALFGSLARGGTIVKRSADDAALFESEGRAVVFSSLAGLSSRVDSPDLDVRPDDFLVLKNAGPKSGYAMPEAGYLPIPSKLARSGVKDMVRISDARMSGTAYGTIVLHVSPESAVVGPLALVKNGDRIRLSVNDRRIDLVVDDTEIARRRSALPRPATPPARGYAKLYMDHVLQAEHGCDFDFLRKA